MTCTRAFIAALIAALIPVSALANARVTSVTAVDGGCVTGPSGNKSNQSWDVQKGKTYQITFSGVTDCANGGTGSSITFVLKNTVGGNTFWTANKASTGVYSGTFILPAGGCETFPVRYCTENGDANSGFEAWAPSGDAKVHMRASTFSTGCSSPSEVSCGVTPVLPSAWGTIKSLYR